MILNKWIRCVILIFFIKFYQISLNVKSSIWKCAITNLNIRLCNQLKSSDVSWDFVRMQKMLLDWLNKLISTADAINIWRSLAAFCKNKCRVPYGSTSPSTRNAKNKTPFANRFCTHCTTTNTCGSQNRIDLPIPSDVFQMWHLLPPGGAHLIRSLCISLSPYLSRSC